VKKRILLALIYVVFGIVGVVAGSYLVQGKLLISIPLIAVTFLGHLSIKAVKKLDI